MDLGKFEPVFDGSNSSSTKLGVQFLPKHTFQRVSLVTAKNHELKAHSVIWILQTILAILDPLVLSVHFPFTFGFRDCISTSALVRPKVKNGVSIDHYLGLTAMQRQHLRMLRQVAVE